MLVLIKQAQAFDSGRVKWQPGIGPATFIGVDLTALVLVVERHVECNLQYHHKSRAQSLRPDSGIEIDPASDLPGRWRRAGHCGVSDHASHEHEPAVKAIFRKTFDTLIHCSALR